MQSDIFLVALVRARPDAGLRDCQPFVQERTERLLFGDYWQSVLASCSDRGFYDMMALRKPVPVLHLGLLCDFLNMDPDEFLDDRNYLLEA